MISKRRKRYSQPQENLRQFSLNNSKGIDSSKAVTDVNTILHSKNLIVNPDGSLSLRKPIKEAGGIPLDKYRQADRVYYTHDPDLYIVQGKHYPDSGGVSEPYDGISIHNANGKQLDFTFKYTTVDGEEKTKTINALTTYSGIDFSESECIPLNTTTVLSGVKFSSSSMHISYSTLVYRYLQISVIGDTVEVVVVTPSDNVVLSSDISVPLSPNLLLDYAYALKDNYNAALPRCRCVLGYGMSNKNAFGIFPYFGETVDKVPKYANPSYNLSVRSRNAKDYRLFSSVRSNDIVGMRTILRAFCDIPTDSTNVYCTWQVSNDGIVWTDAMWQFDGSVAVRENTDTANTKQYSNIRYVPLSKHPDDAVVKLYNSRIVAATPTVCVPISSVTALNGKETNVDGKMYLFKIVSLSKITSEDDMWDSSEGAPVDQYKVSFEYSRVVYTMPYSNVTEFVDSDLPNAAIGKKLYYKRRLYTYGTQALHNNILVSDVNSFTTPLTNIIDVDVRNSDYTTALIPWRDYLISATAESLNIHIAQEDGWITKTVTTATGIPIEDAKCCMAVLNGVIFKSGSRLYQLYPNLYSGSDTMLNLTELSKPVEDILIEHPGDGTQFAFSTESEYILMLPDETETHCLRYNYSLKHWSYCTYPVKFYGFKMYSVDNVHLYGHVIADGVPIYTECVFDADVDADEPYGDTVVNESLDIYTVPIPFSWDTGQKTDSISNTRQFVESKLMFATLSEQDAFPFRLYVAIDGDPHVITKDVSTDAPFWKPSDEASLGVLNTNFRLGGESTPATGAFNTLRQLIVRYSGKGKSIRHVIEGESLHNFKLYETYVRYKNLNIKQ
jgi:hypothetical protein